MAAQKCKKEKKKLLVKIFCIFEFLLTHNPTKSTFNSLDSSRTYGGPLENPKTGVSRELFLPKKMI